MLNQLFKHVGVKFSDVLEILWCLVAITLWRPHPYESFQLTNLELTKDAEAFISKRRRDTVAIAPMEFPGKLFRHLFQT